MTEDADRAYETFQGFLRAALRAYWGAGTKSRVNFLALMFASREAWGVAFDRFVDPATGKKILTGAAGAAAVALLIRTFLGGPIGLLLTGASVASLVALYVRNHRRIWDRAEHYRGLIRSYEPRFDAIRDDYVQGKIRKDQRDLMMDGLLGRFVADVDREDEREEPAQAHEDEFSFARHREDKQREQEQREAKQREDKQREQEQRRDE